MVRGLKPATASAGPETHCSVRLNIFKIYFQLSEIYGTVNYVLMVRGLGPATASAGPEIHDSLCQVLQNL